MAKIFVISDLHLGGAAGLQMCSTKGRQLLADFIDWVADQKTRTGEVRLVVAGDSVDFLAERDASGEFSSFNARESVALGKLNRILDTTAPVWDALRRLCESGAELTLMLGNHDIELSFPALRTHLMDRLGGQRISFLYDNEAFRQGPLLVEHGNRYDGFNQVDHDGLRRHRSQLSRGEEPREAFIVQPGSDLVTKVMNRIKEKYTFVDLLKPETTGVVPILAALDWRLWQKVGPIVEEAARAWYRGGVDADGIPARRELIAGTRSLPRDRDEPAVPYPHEDAFRLADEIARGPSTEKIGWIDDVKVEFLLRAFRKRREKDATTFKVGIESDLYLNPARAAASRGLCSVMGHTHLAKRIKLGETCTYFNTGTWADLICIPDAVYEGSEEAGRKALTAFLESLRSNEIERYRRPVPTFAEIGIEGRALRGDVFFYDGDGRVEPISDAGMTKRLGVEG